MNRRLSRARMLVQLRRQSAGYARTSYRIVAASGRRWASTERAAGRVHERHLNAPAQGFAIEARNVTAPTAPRGELCHLPLAR